MKRFSLIMIALLAVFLCASATSDVKAGLPHLPAIGDVFVFGQYEQDNNPENGLEPIEWLVLAQEDHRVLLLSRFSLDYQSYHNVGGDITWKDAAVRAWLNQNFFLNAFSLSEQDAILEQVLSNAADQGNPEWETSSGDSMEDKVFLLSIAEADHYFSDNNDRKNRGTETARAQGARLWPLEETDWWLRSPGRVQHDAGFVGINGGYHSNAATNKREFVQRYGLMQPHHGKVSQLRNTKTRKHCLMLVSLMKPRPHLKPWEPMLTAMARCLKASMRGHWKRWEPRNMLLPSRSLRIWAITRTAMTRPGNAAIYKQ